MAVIVSLLISVRFWLYSTFIWRWNFDKLLIEWALLWICQLIPNGARISHLRSLLWRCSMAIIFRGIRTSCKSVLTKRNCNFQLILLQFIYNVLVLYCWNIIYITFSSKRIRGNTEKCVSISMSIMHFHVFVDRAFPRRMILLYFKFINLVTLLV